MHVESKGFWFKSSLFAIEAGEDRKTNPGRYGRHLAKWLGEKLRAFGYSVEVIPEDWGWCIMCSRHPCWLWIGCGNMDSDSPGQQKEPPRKEEVVWNCYVVGEFPFWRFSRRGDVKPAVDKLERELSSVLSSQPDIQFVEEP
jgi:hypothetical protein